MRKIPVLLLLTYFGVNGKCQTIMNKDSLLSLLRSAKKDTSLVHLYINLGQQYEDKRNDSARFYYLAANDLSKQLKYVIGELKFIANYTYVLNSEGKLDSGLILNKQAIILATKINDARLIATANGNTGASYQYLEKYDSAVVYYLKAFTYYKSVNKDANVATLSTNLSGLYNDLGQFEKSLVYATEAEEIGRRTNDFRVLSIALNNKANPLINLKRFAEAEKAIIECLKISKNIENDYVYASSLINMANVKIKTQQYSQIKKYAEEALSIAEKIENTEVHNNALRGLSIYYLSQKDYPRADLYSKQSYTEAIENKNINQQQKSAALLSDIALARQDIKSYYRYRIIADSIEVIMNRQALSKTVIELTTKYDTEKKETTIKIQQAEIKQKSTLNYLLGGSAASLLLLSFIGYRNYSNKKKVQQLRITELETEKQLSATEAVLKGEEQERTRLAKDLHDGLGGMLSGIKYSFNNMKENLILTPDTAQAFSRSMDMLDNSIKEMRRVAHNMMPESLLRYGLDKTLQDYTAEINKSGMVAVAYQSMGMENKTVDNTIAITIYRIVQELLNNVTKHAGAKQVLVQLLAQGNKLVVNVEDDGKGFNTEILERVEGIGWKNIKSRVDFLKGTLDVQSAQGKGTAVNMEFNI